MRRAVVESGKIKQAPLSMWVIYCNPEDYVASLKPKTDIFVVRRWEGIIPKEPVGDVVYTLEDARALVPRGTVCLGRDATDPFCIVEVWF